MKRILLVEDEVTISRVLKAYLEKASFQVEQAFNGDTAIEKFETFTPALVLLDVMLPGRDGWSILQTIRQKSTCPVILLTALGQINQRLTGFDQGADDYITKPFVAEEVIARVKAVLRRSANSTPQKESWRSFGNLKVDFRAHSVTLHGLELDFTPRDLSLFIFLTQHPNQTFTREQLIEQVWGIDYEGSDRAVDLAIKRIRKTLDHWPASEGEIRTLRGLGYQFSVQE